jgi:hypothetical protein
MADFLARFVWAYLFIEAVLSLMNIRMDATVRLRLGLGLLGLAVLGGLA